MVVVGYPLLTGLFAINAHFAVLKVHTNRIGHHIYSTSCCISLAYQDLGKHVALPYHRIPKTYELALRRNMSGIFLALLARATLAYLSIHLFALYFMELKPMNGTCYELSKDLLFFSNMAAFCVLDLSFLGGWEWREKGLGFIK